VRDAMQLGYKVIVAYDANAGPSDELHNRAINAMTPVFADAVDTDQLLATFAANVARFAAT
jgi:nicotinamidase-related amidase